MQHKYDIYRPRPRVNDIVDTSRSYYHSPDIALSPFSAVGSLAGMSPRAGRSTADMEHTSASSAVHLTANSPVFRNFKRIQPQDLSDTHNIPVRRPKPVLRYNPVRTVRNTSTPVAPMLSSAWTRLIMAVSSLEFVPKKYTAEAGVRANYNTRTFAIARWTGPALAALSIVVVLLLAVLNPGGFIQKSGSHPPKFISSLFESNRAFAQGSGTSSTAKNSGGTTSRSTGLAGGQASFSRPAAGITSPVQAVANPAQSTVGNTTVPVVPVAPSPIVGGMGGGPILPTTPETPVIPPVTDPIIQPGNGGTTTPIIPPVVQPIVQQVVPPTTNLIQDVTAPVIKPLGL